MSSNNSNKSNKDKDKERQLQENQMVMEFLRVSKKRVEEIRLYQPDLQLSEGEKQVLNTIHSAGMMEGLIAGVATFVILRRTPRFLERMVARRRARAQGYTLDVPSSPFDNIKNGHNNNYHNHNNNIGIHSPRDLPPKRGLLWRSFQFTLDATVSLLMAAYTSSYMADVPTIVQQVTDIPLMEGRSAISDHFCTALVEEYKRQWNLDPNSNSNSNNSTSGPFGRVEKSVPPFDHKPLLKDPQETILKGHILFIQNCQKRQAMERQLRKERGLPPDQPVEIPSPGVPTDLLMQDWNTGDDDHEGTDINNGVWTEDDASSFVTDQEEQRRG
jgi:hypothetical protein